MPTNDWWSSILFKRTNCAYGEPMFAHPLGFKAQATGLGFSYTTTPAVSGTATTVGEYHFPYTEDFVAGVAALNASQVMVDGWSDWTVSPLLSDGTRSLRATIGEGLPFSYFNVSGGAAQISATGGTPTVWTNSGAMLGYTVNGHDYVAFAPTGATWTQSGTTFTSTLAGKNYFSVAVLPTTSATSVADRSALATSYARYAYNFVTGTKVSYSYNQATSIVATNYAYTTTAAKVPGAARSRRCCRTSGNTSVRLAAGADLRLRARASQDPDRRRLVHDDMVFQGVLPELPAVADSAART